MKSWRRRSASCLADLSRPPCRADSGSGQGTQCPLRLPLPRSGRRVPFSSSGRHPSMRCDAKRGDVRELSSGQGRALLRPLRPRARSGSDRTCTRGHLGTAAGEIRTPSITASPLAYRDRSGLLCSRVHGQRRRSRSGKSCLLCLPLPARP